MSAEISGSTLNTAAFETFRASGENFTYEYAISANGENGRGLADARGVPFIRCGAGSERREPRTPRGLLRRRGKNASATCSGCKVLAQKPNLHRYGFIKTRTGVVEQSEVAVGDIVPAFRFRHQVKRFSSDVIIGVDHLVLR